MATGREPWLYVTVFVFALLLGICSVLSALFLAGFSFYGTGPGHQQGGSKLPIAHSATGPRPAQVPSGQFDQVRQQDYSAVSQPRLDQGPAIDPVLAIALVRDILNAVNHANWTGNYSVLRDYASPAFATANDPTRLTTIFQPIRAEGLDLFPAQVLVPVFSQNRFVDQGRLLLEGFFPSRPKHIRFRMIFASVQNRWRLNGIAIAGSPASDMANAAKPTPSVPTQVNNGQSKTARTPAQAVTEGKQTSPQTAPPPPKTSKR